MQLAQTDYDKSAWQIQTYHKAFFLCLKSNIFGILASPLPILNEPTSSAADRAQNVLNTRSDLALTLAEWIR